MKDFCHSISKDVSDVAEIPDAVFQSKQAVQAMDLRQQNMIFPKAKLIEEGGCNIDDQIDVMREAILKKDGIVGAEAQEDFRYFVKNCININVLDQIGGELNSFEKRSFRMRQLSLKKSHTMEEKEINSLE